MAPRFLSQKEMQRFRRLFSSLLRRKTGPFMPAFSLGRTGLFQVARRLRKPILGTIRQSEPLFDALREPHSKPLSQSGPSKSIRVMQHEKGLPCQTLISSILYKFSAGRLVEASAIRQVVAPLK